MESKENKAENLKKRLEEKNAYSSAALARAMFKLIPDWHKLGLHCFFCCSKLSVKYEMDFVPMGDNKPMTVPVCNRCVLIHSKQKLDWRL